MRVIVIGAGIAGLATAAELVRRGADVRVLEREAHPFVHASGSNAAIYRPLELSTGVAELGLRSAELLDELVGERSGWLAARPLWLVASNAEPLADLRRLADAWKIDTEMLDGPEVGRRQRWLDGGSAHAALIHDGAGVVDPHAIATALMARLRGRVELGQSVASLRVVSGRVTGAILEGGAEREADAVVVAAGAWSGSLGEGADLPLPLAPLRRHLVILEPHEPATRATPTVWDVESEIYFRPESAGLLASPCDEQRWPPSWPPSPPHTDPAALELLAVKLARLSPTLAPSQVKRAWACLRTFAPDRAAVVGLDPRLDGLVWTTGLGGFGMTAGMAVGELAARCLLDGVEPPPALAVKRLL